MTTKKMTFSLPLDMIERIADYNEQTGIPKSTMVQLAIKQYLDSQKMLESMPDMLKQMRELMEEAKYQRDIEQVKDEHAQMKKDGLLK